MAKRDNISSEMLIPRVREGNNGWQSMIADRTMQARNRGTKARADVPRARDKHLFEWPVCTVRAHSFTESSK